MDLALFKKLISCSVAAAARAIQTPVTRTHPAARSAAVSLRELLWPITSHFLHPRADKKFLWGTEVLGIYGVKVAVLWGQNMQP